MTAIQICSFSFRFKVNAIVIQGASHALLSSQRVIEYSVQYSNDLDTWFDVMDEMNEVIKVQVFKMMSALSQCPSELFIKFIELILNKNMMPDSLWRKIGSTFTEESSVKQHKT